MLAISAVAMTGTKSKASGEHLTPMVTVGCDCTNGDTCGPYAYDNVRGYYCTTPQNCGASANCSISVSV